MQTERIQGTQYGVCIVMGSCYKNKMTFAVVYALLSVAPEFILTYLISSDSIDVGSPRVSIVNNLVLNSFCECIAKSKIEMNNNIGSFFAEFSAVVWS